MKLCALSSLVPITLVAMACSSTTYQAREAAARHLDCDKDSIVIEKQPADGYVRALGCGRTIMYYCDDVKDDGPGRRVHTVCSPVSMEGTEPKVTHGDPECVRRCASARESCRRGCTDGTCEKFCLSLESGCTEGCSEEVSRRRTP